MTKSTVTTERLEDIASDVAMQGYASEEEQQAMARELLAVREAQSVPVASTTKSNIDAVLGGVSTVIWPVRCFKGETHVNLYTAPPAPALQQCFHDAIDDMENVMAWIMKLPVPTDGATAKAGRLKNSIAACRAAMLQPVSQGYTLPAGWIACSDRMPTEGGRYLAWVEEQNSLGLSCYVDNVAWHDDAVGFRATGAVNFWMPLPAAPTPTKAVNDGILQQRQ